MEQKFTTADGYIKGNTREERLKNLILQIQSDLRIQK